MKKKLLLASTVFMTLSAMHAQDGVGIGKSIIPDGAAVLDVGSDSKGILIPRVTLTGEGDDKTVTGGVYPESLLVYHKKGGTSTLESGFYFWLGGKWNALVSKTSTTTSEVLTTLEISADGDKVVLTYTGEDKKPVPIAVSDRLQKDPDFNAYIKSLVTSTAAGVELVAGTGITVVAVPPAAGETLTKYTISAKTSEIELKGDVTGKADATSIDKIKGTTVSATAPSEEGQALVYIGGEWKPGKPKIDNTSVTDKANLTVDSSLDFTNGTGTGALLSATGLKVKAGGITDVHLVASAVTEEKILDGAVTELKIQNSAVTTGKIKGGTKGQVLISGDANTTEWVDQTTIVPKVVSITTDGSLDLDGGVGAVLSKTDLKVKTRGITDTHLAQNAVIEEKIQDGAVTESKIKDASVTNAKIVGGTKGQVLISGDANATAWGSIQETAVTGGAGVTVTDAIVGNVKTYTVTTVPTGITLTGDVSGTAGATSVDRIKATPVSTTKPTIEGQALIFDGTNWTPGMPKLDGSNVTFKNDLKGGADGVIHVDAGEAVMLKDVTLSINAKSIKSGLIDDGEVKTANIADVNVTTAKIADNAVTLEKLADAPSADYVLKANANKKPEWVAQNTIIPQGADLTAGDGTIVVGTGTGAVLKAATLKVAPTSITDTHLANNAVTNVKVALNTLTVDKLATDPANKNKRLTTDGTGKPAWESKFTSVKLAPVATNDVVDGKRVYTHRITTGTVKEPNAAAPLLGYNSIMEAIPVANIDYLLTAQVFDKNNKLVAGSVTDVTNTKNTSVQFRFGVNSMFTTLAVGSEYIVILRYVSTETVVE